MAKMDEAYFDEKKDFALANLEDAITHIDDLLGFMRASQYSVPDLIAPRVIHGGVATAINRLMAARINFEKSRWASTNTETEFDEWLMAQGCEDLVSK